MGLHEVNLNALAPDRLASLDCWAVSTSDLEQLAVALLGQTPGGWVRQGKARAMVAQRKFGSSADRLSQEFARLAEQVATIRKPQSLEAELLAAAFFHLRFEDNIHPLRDGNGRVGRLLMAEQCRHAFGIPPADFLAALHECEPDYRALFSAPSPELQYELLVHLLARILAVPLPKSFELPFPLTPVFPERDTRPLNNQNPARAPLKHRSAFF